MLNRSLPYFLEDRTGSFSHTDFDDIYDRLFLHVSPPSSSPHPSPSPSPSSSPSSSTTSITITSCPRRSSHHSTSPTSPTSPTLTSTQTTTTTTRRLSSYTRENPDSPSITLDFGQRGTLGNVIFCIKARRECVPLGSWLKKTGLFSGSLSRKFRASDGEEYRWVYRGAEGHEWTLVTPQDTPIAHFNPKPANKPAYGTSGNVLTIYESFGGVALEIVASLTAMRYIAANGL